MRASLTIGVALLAGCGPAPYTIGPEEPSSGGAQREEPGIAVVAIPAATAETEPSGWTTDGLPRVNPFVEHRTWVGDYDCPQGRTSLTLRIVDVTTRGVRGIFDFHHAPTNVAGQFLIAGKFEEQTGRVTLAPGAWLIHPDNYVTVGMVGRTSKDGMQFTGRIAAAGCGAFRLRAAQ